jgi:hypothetical protein
MRSGKSRKSSTIQLTEDDYLAAIRPLAPTDERAVARACTSQRPLDERTLIDELWRISHFGWIREAVIRSALTLARGQEMPADSLHQGLRQLLDHGWVEHRDSDEEDHWRLSHSGRDARVS